MKGALFLTAVVAAALPAPARAADPPGLRVYLPRNVAVDGDSLVLGQIAVMSCADDAVLTKAAGIAMGRAPWSREALVIDRATILSRLATCGVAAPRVQFSGAEKVTVNRNEKTIARQEVLKLAEAFLQKSRPAGDEARLQLVREPNELVLPEGKEVSLKPRLSDGPPSGHVKVEVAAVCDGQEVGVSDVLFKMVYPVRRAVAVKDIPSGAVITEDNARIEIVTADSKSSGAWVSPYGMVALQRLPAGAVIRPALLMNPKAAPVVKRNQTVTMKIEGVGFKVIARGEALDDGRTGEFVKVRNVDTKRIVTARVHADGTVEPVGNEERE
jgi:flagella basal body P-ring formation protein FlgA